MRANPIDELVSIASDLDDTVAAEMALDCARKLTRTRCNELAAAYLLDMVRNERRRKVAVIERRAFTHAPVAVVDAPEVIAERAERSRERQDAVLRDERERNRRLNQELQAHMDKYAQSMHIKWTTELLEAKFSRRDGTSIAWGDATYQDHEERVEIHLGNAAAGIDGAARHQAALGLLRETGAHNLNEAVSTAA